MDIITRRCLKCNSIYEAEEGEGHYNIHLLDALGGWEGPECHFTSLVCPSCFSTMSVDYFIDEIEED